MDAEGSPQGTCGTSAPARATVPVPSPLLEERRAPPLPADAHARSCTLGLAAGGIGGSSPPQFSPCAPSGRSGAWLLATAPISAGSRPQGAAIGLADAGAAGEVYRWGLCQASHETAWETFGHKVIHGDGRLRAEASRHSNRSLNKPGIMAGWRAAETQQPLCIEAKPHPSKRRANNCTVCKHAAIQHETIITQHNGDHRVNRSTLIEWFLTAGIESKIDRTGSFTAWSRECVGKLGRPSDHAAPCSRQHHAHEASKPHERGAAASMARLCAARDG